MYLVAHRLRRVPSKNTLGVFQRSPKYILKLCKSQYRFCALPATNALEAKRLGGLILLAAEILPARLGDLLIEWEPAPGAADSRHNGQCDWPPRSSFSQAPGLSDKIDQLDTAAYKQGAVGVKLIYR